MKEMVGGCCVCSDESGWDENPLVYCDGEGCDVAVHQACYGIVTVPLGPWFCRKCESQERPTNARCELCPGKAGALKPTDTGGWAHVVCALYIPEVRFGDVATMEPVLVSIVPPERFSKPCCLCELAGRTSRAVTGATMSCNKPGCRQRFHVTCAQSHGLLCEEQVQSMNVTYCGYCPHHYAKLKRGHNLKAIPAFKAGHDSATPDVSPEKQPPAGDVARAERRHKKPKHARSPRASAATPPLPAPSAPAPASSDALRCPAPASSDALRCPASATSGAAQPTLLLMKTEPAGGEAEGAAAVRFTTANFTEAVVTPSGAVFGGEVGGDVAGQETTPAPAQPDSKDVGGIKQELEQPREPEQPALLGAGQPAAGAAGQVASLPVAASTALPVAQTAESDSASVKRPAPAADKEPRKRKPPGRPRKQPAAAASPDTAAAATGDWAGAAAAGGAAGAGAGAAAGASAGRSGGAAPVALNGLTAPHMIGNQLNPATPLGESLAAEMAEQADYLEPSGPLQALAGRTAVTPAQWRRDTAAAPFPRSLTELLERQWQQGSHFLMEQAQQMDISALLSCLYQLRQENEQMEQHMGVVSQRRDHLLAVHARLSVPLESVAPSVVSARAAAVRHQRAADADLASTGRRVTPPRPALENGVTGVIRLPAAIAAITAATTAAPAPAAVAVPARPQINGRTGMLNGAAPPAPPPSPVVSVGSIGPGLTPPPPASTAAAAAPSSWMPASTAVAAAPSSWMPASTAAAAAPSSWMPASTAAAAAPSSWMPASTAAAAAPSSWMPASTAAAAAPSSRPPVSQSSTEHRTVEALRLRVSATSSGGFPQYQLVSPPGDGRSASGRPRGSDG